MPLNTSQLEKDIQAAFDNESDKSVKPSEARQRTAKAIAAAVEKFVKSGTVTVAAGIPVATAGSPTAQTGATTATGTGTIG